MVNPTRRANYADMHAKNEGNPGDGFGNEIERMLMDRPTTRQANGVAASGNTGGATNTLDELMAELGMLRGDRGELARNGTRMGPRISSGDGGLLGIGPDVALRPITPRVSMATGSGGALGGAQVASSQLSLPPAKGAMPAPPSTAAGAAAAAGVVTGGVQVPSLVSAPHGRPPSPMSTRRSVPGVMPTQSPPGAYSSPVLGGSSSAPPVGVLERQALLEMRLEKMESREQQLMALVAQLQHQVFTLSRAQQTTQQQILSITAPPSPTYNPLPPPSPQRPPGDISNSPPSPIPDPNSPSSPAPRPVPASANPTTPQQQEPSEEAAAGIRDGETAWSPVKGDVSPKQHRSFGNRPSVSPHPPTPPQAGTPPQGGGTQRPVPSPPSTGPPPPGSSGRPNANKLVPTSGPPAEWEADVSQLRKEVGALAANVVRLREQLNTLVPGGPSPLSEEVAAQAGGAEQLKQNLTQIAMDVVALHKGLTTLKQNSERSHASLEKAITDMQLQAQTNALNLLASGAQGGAPAVDSVSAYGGGGNAVASALAATGGVSGTLEESLRAAFARPAMRSVPAFNPTDMGLMPGNAGAAAAVAAFGGMGGGGGGGRKDQPAAAGGAGGGGLGAAWALLNSFEEQAAAEKEEQQRAAAIAHQAVSIVDAKVKQVVMHVHQHMRMISDDVEERLRMYEQTIIRMAQQIDRLQRLLRDMDEAGPPRLVVQRVGAEVDGTGPETAGGRKSSPPAAQPSQEQAPLTDGDSAAKSNWIKAAAMATGRFVPQKEEKKQVARAPHGYFRAPP